MTRAEDYTGRNVFVSFDKDMVYRHPTFHRPRYDWWWWVMIEFKSLPRNFSFTLFMHQSHNNRKLSLKVYWGISVLLFSCINHIITGHVSVSSLSCFPLYCRLISIVLDSYWRRVLNQLKNFFSLGCM